MPQNLPCPRIVLATLPLIVLCGLLGLAADQANAAAIDADSAPPTDRIEWHHPLYLTGGGYWRQRVPVTIRNDTDTAMEGHPVAVPIGSQEGDLPLGGTDAQAIRLVDSRGVEMVFDLTGPGGQAIRTGRVPTESRLIMPVDCPPAGAVTYFVYFDNPEAGLVPDYLDTKRRGTARGRGKDARVQAGSVEHMRLSESDPTPGWQQAPSDPGKPWKHRAVVRVCHLSDEPIEQALVRVDLTTLSNRMRGRLNPHSILVTDRGRRIRHVLFGDSLLFEAGFAGRSARTFCVYFTDDSQVEATPQAGPPALLSGVANLLENPGFESGQPLPDAWTATQPGKAGDVVLSTDAPGGDGFGKQCVKMHVPHDTPQAWRGWHQTVSVKPGRSYVFAAQVRTKDVRGGQVRLHAHCHTVDGSLCRERGFLSAGEPLEGTRDWTLLSGLLEMPRDAAQLDLHLTMDATGTVWHDNVLVAEVVAGPIVRLEARPMPKGELAVWPVPAMEKVFPDTPAPDRKPAARLSLARNEKEPLQLALRAGHPIDDIRIAVDAPARRDGSRLKDIEVAVVGYVPIDHATNYYRSEAPAWYRKFPTLAASCDGWPGLWPDPLLPRDQVRLPANQTQAIWITVSAGSEAAAGDYRGAVRLESGGQTLAELPLDVRLWDFTLPDQSHVAAIYDVRFGPGDRYWSGSREARYDATVALMGRNRLCPDAVRPDPQIRYENGKVVADFAEFDRAAERYFDDLGLPFSYTPRTFYLFGWGHPPKSFFGQQPYPGQFPYEGVDRSQLRPEYKRAYQACLAAFWDHVKEKGWQEKFILYISDEPHFRHPHIVEQMKALCNMIHEVDPAIPIYSSTWSHIPEWDGYVDVWGISHYGRVAVDTMRQLKQQNGRIWFTTDGQMCTDTPYCAVERLLPHYCFKYGAQAYEFWGITWLTYNPYDYGWHAYIRQSSEPGTQFWVRYPNGDGYLLYPGGAAAGVAVPGPVTSIRFEQAREGVEDYEYLYMLRELVAEAKSAGRDASSPEAVLQRASELVEIPNAGGRWSSKILPDPSAVYRLRHAAAEAIEELVRQVKSSM